MTPASTIARDADTSAPRVPAKHSSISKPSLLPTPRPPDTNTLASVISIRLFCSFTVFRIFTLNFELSKLIFIFSTTPCREESLGLIRITPGRTVDICGRCSLQMMVAIRLPPNAGRVISKSRSSEISRAVQSAVRPVERRADSRGPKSRPMVVAPISTMAGRRCRMNCVMACA